MVENQSWTSEFRDAFRNAADLYSFLGLSLPADLQEVAKSYPLFIPRKLAAKIKSAGNTGPLALQFLPSILETDPDLNEKGLFDPIGDKNYFRAPQLIHRYETRALFTPTTVCPVHCRYCFRKNELAASDELFQQDFVETLSYLSEHPEISEIIFTGGDPLTLTNDKLRKYLEALSLVTSIKDIRFHTRYPVILPGRIDEGLLELLRNFTGKFRTVSLAIHANHVEEFDPENKLAIRKLAATGIQLLSQTVLLRGVNDQHESLKELMEIFIEMKVRPYYLHHPDQVKGGMHFYLPLHEGRKLYASLRNKLPGWAIPQYVIDIPEGHGKVPAFNPEGSTFSGQLMAKNGQLVNVQEPDFFV